MISSRRGIVFASMVALFVIADMQSASAEPPRFVPERDATAQAQPAAAAKPRSSGALFFDEKLRRVVLLNGVVPPEKPELGQLWAWDGKAWSLVPAQGPSMRTVFGAAYDTRRKRIVLFGGTGNTALLDKRDDTWEWDGRAWHRMADTSAGTRDHHGMVYDAGRRRTVLYGGVTSENLPDGSRAPAKDTWEWDGKKWTRIAAQGAMPPGGGAMAYDAKRKQVVLFGGMYGRARSSETWAWDGKVWRKLADAGPAGRNGHAMVFDPRAGVVLLMGGTPGGGVQFADFWQWNGERWSEIKASGPAPSKRSSTGLTYHPQRKTVLLYGGHFREDGQTKDLVDMWEWDGKQWKQLQ